MYFFFASQMIRHVVFADCADAPQCTADPHLSDVFVAMAYGLYPFCVQEDATGSNLVFRRVALPSDKEKDRARRLSEAADALQSLPAVLAYNAALSDGNQQIHVVSSAVFVSAGQTHTHTK